MGYQEVQDLQNQLASRFSLASQPMQQDLVTRSWTAGAQLKQQPQKSVLGLLDRAKYGFADDIGQQQIIMQATGKQPVKLKNGQYGIEDVGPNGQKIIRPVDPKGFQMSDVFGDIAESLGKTITAGGGAVGGGLGLLAGGAGSIAGAGAGAGAGELVRQQIGNLLGVRGTEITEGPNKGKFAKTRFGELGDQEDWGEAVGEAIFGATGQGLALGASYALGKIAQTGIVKGATNKLDDVLNKGPKAENVEYIAKNLGIGDKNADVIKEGFEKGYQIYDNMGDIIKKTDKGLVDLVENKNQALFKKFLEPELQKAAQQQGVQNLDDVVIQLAPTKKALKDLVTELTPNKVIKGLNKESLDEVNYYKNIIRGAKDITYGDFKTIGKDLSTAVKQAYETSNYKKAEVLDKIYDTFVDSRTGVLDDTVFKQYSKARGSLNKLNQLFRTQIVEGEFKAGQTPMVAKLAKFSKEIQGTNYDELKNLLNVAKESGIEGAQELEDNVGTFLFNDVLEKAKRKPGAVGKVLGSIPGVSGVAQVISEPFTTAKGQAKILQGLMNMKIIDKSQLGKQVSERVLPRVNTLVQLVNARRLLDAGTPMKEVVKNVSPQVAKIIKNVAKNKGVQAGVAGAPGQIITRSLNQILFDGNGMNQ